MQVLHEKILDNYPDRLTQDDNTILLRLLGEAGSYDDLKLIDKQFQVFTGMIAERKEGGSLYQKPTKNNEYKNLAIYLENRVYIYIYICIYLSSLFSSLFFFSFFNIIIIILLLFRLIK